MQNEVLARVFSPDAADVQALVDAERPEKQLAVAAFRSARGDVDRCAGTDERRLGVLLGEDRGWESLLADLL